MLEAGASWASAFPKQELGNEGKRGLVCRFEEKKTVSSQNSNVNPKNPISSSSVYAVSRISCEGVTLKFWEDTKNMYTRKEVRQYLNTLQNDKNYSFRKIRHVEFKPTYRSNFVGKNDPFWYRLEMFSDDLKWNDFVFAIDRFRTSGGLDMVTFTGGEPTLWGGLERALGYCHQYDLITAMTINGTQIPKVFPCRLKINLKAYFEGSISMRKIIRENIKKLPDKMGFLYFFSEEDSPDIIQQAVQFAKAKSGYVYFAPEFQTDQILSGKYTEDFPGYKPSVRLKKLWLYSAELVQQELGKQLRFDWAVPRSLFSTEEIKKMKCISRFCGNCDFCPVGRFLINPDGQTIYPCPFLEIGADISDYYGSMEFYEKQFLDKKKGIDMSYGGCAGMKVLAKNRKKV